MFLLNALLKLLPIATPPSLVSLLFKIPQTCCFPRTLLSKCKSFSKIKARVKQAISFLKYFIIYETRGWLQRNKLEISF